MPQGDEIKPAVQRPELQKLSDRWILGVHYRVTQSITPPYLYFWESIAYSCDLSTHYGPEDAINDHTAGYGSAEDAIQAALEVYNELENPSVKKGIDDKAT